ncbi:7-cyano-7-deazaguanine synthase QueC [Helicobacter burdigaliensis]|uniref:7-cyano-7-deazaguanine synthase QueC n=1 Tax=Helicobacter burdigaliensis TaxID=2315334 RepID=UPI000EF677C8|nr:7-cyano-7-deazaguanine synthase QueC [Helicobacter burdigaliensis]
MKKALCILSGGMDSTLCAYLAKKEGYEIVAIHFNYGQRTQSKEKECFEAICKELQVYKSYSLDMDFLKVIGGNALVDLEMAVPKNELGRVGEVPTTYVPFRNGVFLSVAGSIAEKEGCERIYIGVIEADGSGYPDCTKNFIQKAQDFINEGTTKDFKVTICTPLLQFKKADIVKKSLELEVPLELTWSCYESSEEACGECDSCLLRLRGFKEIGVQDKIPYKKNVNKA